MFSEASLFTGEGGDLPPGEERVGNPLTSSGGHCSDCRGRYGSYWNAFLFEVINVSVSELTLPCKVFMSTQFQTDLFFFYRPQTKFGAR